MLLWTFHFPWCFIVGLGSWGCWYSWPPSLSVCHLCILEGCKPPGKTVSCITRSSRSSYVDEDCDSLALCDPMQRMNYEVDSLPESCFDSGLSTLRDSNEYDSEVEYKNQRGFQNSQRVQESCAGDASDMDVSQDTIALWGHVPPSLTCICRENLL